MRVHKLSYIRLWIAAMLSLALLIGALRPHAVTPAFAGGSRFKPDEIIVGLNLASGVTIADINATYGTSVLAILSPTDGIYELTTPDTDMLAIIEQMGDDTRLKFAEPNYIGQSPEADPSRIKSWGGLDPTLLDSQYAIEMLHIARAHDFSLGTGVIVAVIDTGVQLDHPALATSFTDTGYDFVDNDAIPDDLFNDIDDDADGLIDEGSGHGTHVSGIIHLVAPEAQIMPLRVLDTEGNGDIFAVAEAIQYAVSHGANVINLSLGTPTLSNLLRDVIREATRAGVIVVAAAGNVNSSVAQYPGADQCTIGVTSVDTTSVKSPFASYGGWVDIAAPGESIYSAYPPSGYAWWSGTSMATPFVAGQAALIKSLRPDLNARNTMMLIGETAGALDKANPKLADLLGGGQADIGASLAVVASGQLPIAGGYMSSGCVEPDAS